MLHDILRRVLSRIHSFLLVSLLIGPVVAEEIDWQRQENLVAISKCVRQGQEAVLLESREAVCAPRRQARAALAEHRAKPINSVDVIGLCGDDARRVLDRRILDRRDVKRIHDLSGGQGHAGIRLTNAIFCDGLDLEGLDLDHTLAVDRSIVWGTTPSGEWWGNVETRNFKTKGDLSFDDSLIYGNIRIVRADIKGSLYVSRSFANHVEIENSTIGGDAVLERSLILRTIEVRSDAIRGYLSVERSYIGGLSVHKSRIDGVLNLNKSQARCYYDVRGSEFGDLIGIDYGFGVAHQDKPGQVNNNFERAKDGSDLFSIHLRNAVRMPAHAFNCESDKEVHSGVVIIAGNKIGGSFCMRYFRGLSGKPHPTAGTIYLFENSIAGAIWFGLGNPEREMPAGKTLTIKVFNLNVGTLITDFKKDLKDIELTVQHLQFQRVYTSSASCQSAILVQGGGSGTGGRVEFPPDLLPPDPSDVLKWIETSKLVGPQPFSQFVRAFEQGGDETRAKQMRISREWATIRENMARLPSLLPEWRTGATAQEHAPPMSAVTSPASQPPVSGTAKVLDAIGSIFSTGYGVVADFGYTPEKALLWMGGILLSALAYFHIVLGVIAFRTASGKIRKVGLLFLFDRLVPAYRIRESNYEISKFYAVAPSNWAEPTYHVRYPWLRRIREASVRQERHAEKALDLLRFAGAILAIFIAAAIGRLVH